MEENNKNSLSQNIAKAPQCDADKPVTPAQPDPDDVYDEPEVINWKERLYDRIPEKKVPAVLKFLNLLIPALFVLIVVVLIVGALK